MVIPPSLSAAPQDIELRIVYEDEVMAVIDKPAGLVVHPAPGHPDGTLVNGLVRRYPAIAGSDEFRPGIVHRLDKDTSGLLVVALAPAAQLSLSRQLKARTMHRRYTSLVWGDLRPDRGSIDIPVGRDRASRGRMAAGADAIGARAARTQYTVVERLRELSLLDVVLETGRTHQIRVHMAYIGHPVAGDKLYGGRGLPGLTRQFLHAAELELSHPTTGTAVRFTSPLPPDLNLVLAALIESEKVPRL
jgi:23S rRNA pseudouridine1911/1915/1917 synthase